MKYHITSFLIVSFSSLVSCQSEKVTVSKEKDFAEKIVEKACELFSEEDISLEKYLAQVVSVIQNDDTLRQEYQSKLLAYKDTSKIDERLDSYLKFILRRDCQLYRTAYNEEDESYYDQLLVRNAYLNNRNLIFDILDNKSVDKLVKYFEVKNETKLREDLKLILKGFNDAKAETNVYMFQLEREDIAFYNNFYGYTGGGEKFFIGLVFDSAGEKIVEYGFRYGELKVTKN